MVDFLQFVRWPGKHSILAWLESYLQRVLLAFQPSVRNNRLLVQDTPSPRLTSASVSSISPRSPRFSPPRVVSTAGVPWAKLTTHDMMRVFAAETWDGQFNVNEFAHVLQKVLNLDRGVEATALARRLFPALDRDNSGLLDFQEVFIGMAMLCSDSHEDKLRSVFEIMDADRSGRISRTELEQFLVHIAPWRTTSAEIQIVRATIMFEADTNHSGFLTFSEVNSKALAAAALSFCVHARYIFDLGCVF